MGLAPHFRSAAVLVPVIVHDDEPKILLTLRTAHLAAHAGQVSFPGGRCEDDDYDALATALRETEEEIGIPADRIEPIGRLDTYVTRTGFRVIPIVGLVQPPISLRLNPEEVADAFEVPISVFTAPGHPVRQSVEIQNVQREFYVFPFQDRFIWGATAGMLNNLREVLADSC